MASDMFNAYNSLRPVDLNVLMDANPGNYTRSATGVHLVGFLKGFCNPPEVETIELRNKHYRWGVLSLIGCVCNCGASNPNARLYGKASGEVLIIVPPHIAKNYSANHKPFITVGSRIASSSKNNDLIQCIKFERDGNTWTAEPCYTVELFKPTQDGVLAPTSIKIFNNSMLDLSVFMHPLKYLEKKGYIDYTIKDPTYRAASAGVNFFMTDDFSLKQEIDRVKREEELGPTTGVFTPPETSNSIGVSDDKSWADRIKKPGVFKVESRKELKKVSKHADYLQDKLFNSKKSVEDVLSTMDSYEGMHSIEDAIEFTAKQLRANWNKKGTNTKKGSELFLSAVQRVDDVIAADGEDSPLGREMTIKKADILDSWLDMQFFEEAEESGKASEKKEVAVTLSEKRYQIYFAIIESILGINGLADVWEASGQVDIYSIMLENPYYLCLLDARINIKSLDMLAMLYRTDRTDPKVKKLRNVAFMHNAMLGGDRDSVLVGDTVATVYALKQKLRMQYRVGKRVGQNVAEYGSILIPSRISDLKTFIKPDIVKSDMMFEEGELKEITWGNTGDYFCVIKASKDQAIKDYLDSGVGIQLSLDGNEYITDFVLAKKEQYIYDKVYRLAQAPMLEDIDEAQLEKAVKDFERMKGFQLEPLQADAVKLLKHMVVCLTGPAGSGKTTTAEAILYAIQTLLGVPDEEILFCAPTGKAANRLREVVKKPTGTIHSKYRIIGDDMSLRDAKDAKATSEEAKNIKVLIVDESSMITIDLMYNMLRKVDEGTRIYFLGDIEQLPAIGFGKPFANLLSFLPCVKLEVSKRASEKSLINYNAKVIINNSGEGTDFLPLRNGDDFKLIQADVQSAVDITNRLVRWHLGLTNVTPVPDAQMINQLANLKPDDIQIISPFSAKSKASSTANLNNLVQDAFNPRIKNQRVYRIIKDRNGDDVVEFRMGDRVINNKNNSAKVQYLETDEGLKANGTGIMNGDVGKIVGFYSPDNIKLAPDEDDTYFQGSQSTIFIAVKFDSIDNTGAECQFICFYRTNELMVQGNDVTVAYSPDMHVIDLAYALTVHKLQGSQAKLIMFIVAEGTPSFICRNLIYTAITRAKEGAYILGDVTDAKGRKSLISLGRQNETANSRESIMDKL